MQIRTYNCTDVHRIMCEGIGKKPNLLIENGISIKIYLQFWVNSGFRVLGVNE